MPYEVANLAESLVASIVVALVRLLFIMHSSVFLKR